MKVIKVLSEGLVGVFTSRGRQLWSCGKIRKARWHERGRTCEECGELYPPGSVMWKEVTQCSMNRMDRVCDPCMQRMIKEAGTC